MNLHLTASHIVEAKKTTLVVPVVLLGDPEVLVQRAISLQLL